MLYSKNCRMDLIRESRMSKYGKTHTQKKKKKS